MGLQNYYIDYCNINCPLINNNNNNNNSQKKIVFAAKQCPQVPKYFETCGKTFMVQAKTTKVMKVLALECFVLHGITSGILHFIGYS